MSRPKKIMKTYEMSGFSFLVALIFIVGRVDPGFQQPASILNCFNDSVVFTLLAMGGVLVILTGEIDVSAGAILGIPVAMGVALLRDDFNQVVAVLAALVVGAIVGFVNGFGVSVLRVSSLIFTLGVNGAARGLIHVFTEGAWVEDLPVEYIRMSDTLIARQFTTFYVVTILVVITGHMVLTQTKKGKYFIAVGGNAAGATFVGVPVSQTKTTACIVSGVSAAAADMIYTSCIGLTTPITDDSCKMKAIAVCIPGGIGLTRGQDSLTGTFIGTIIMSSISRILIFLGFFPDYDNTTIGVLLITIVMINTVMQNRIILKSRYQILSTGIAMGADKRGGAQS